MSRKTPRNKMAKRPITVKVNEAEILSHARDAAEKIQKYINSYDLRGEPRTMLSFYDIGAAVGESEDTVWRLLSHFQGSGSGITIEA
jgi:hypothetical protein